MQKDLSKSNAVYLVVRKLKCNIFRKLAGLTIFITGASRGIGKAIALKAARDGANIIIAAKTAEPHSKLDGTIYTAAKESEYISDRLIFLNIIVANFSRSSWW